MYNCNNCGKMVLKERRDGMFCSAKCKAQYHRQGTPDSAHEDKRPGSGHAQKAREAHGNCEYCQKSFAYNEYADRGGKRAPKYCSNVCRSAAFRWRNNPKNPANAPKKERTSAPPKKERTSAREEAPNMKFRKLDPHVILGVPFGCSKKTAKAAYMRLVALWHPDINKSPEATVRMQEINTAYDFWK